MPAYVVYRPSVMRSGRLVVRAAAVAALALAAGVAFVVVTHTGGQSNALPVGARAARHRFAVARQGCAHHAATQRPQGGREASGRTSPSTT